MGKKKRKGCFTFLFIIFAVIAGIIIATVLNGGSLSFTTARITDIETAAGIDQETFEPVDITDTFSPDSPAVYIMAKVKNAPEGTVIKAVFIYTDLEYEIDQAEVTMAEVNDNIYFSLSKPDSGFPYGDYEIKLYIDDKYKESAYFKVK